MTGWCASPEADQRRTTVRQHLSPGARCCGVWRRTRPLRKGMRGSNAPPVRSWHGASPEAPGRPAGKFADVSDDDVVEGKRRLWPRAVPIRPGLARAVGGIFVSRARPAGSAGV